MSTEDSSNSKKNNWLTRAKVIIPIILGILAFLFGSGAYYNLVYLRPVLSYQVLPDYNLGLGNGHFAGLINLWC